MTIDRETAIRLGEQACDVEIDHRGRKTYSFDDHGLERFAALVLEHGRKPLTDEKIQETTGASDVYWAHSKIFILGIARAIEAAHGITNKESSDAE